jgi:hypothetical protein
MDKSRSDPGAVDRIRAAREERDRRGRVRRRERFA